MLLAQGWHVWLKVISFPFVLSPTRKSQANAHKQKSINNQTKVSGKKSWWRFFPSIRIISSEENSSKMRQEKIIIRYQINREFSFRIDLPDQQAKRTSKGFGRIRVACLILKVISFPPNCPQRGNLSKQAPSILGNNWSKQGVKIDKCQVPLSVFFNSFNPLVWCSQTKNCVWVCDSWRWRLLSIASSFHLFLEAWKVKCRRSLVLVKHDKKWSVNLTQTPHLSMKSRLSILLTTTSKILSWATSEAIHRYSRVPRIGIVGCPNWF